MFHNFHRFTTGLRTPSNHTAGSTAKATERAVQRTVPLSANLFRLADLLLPSFVQFLDEFLRHRQSLCSIRRCCIVNRQSRLVSGSSQRFVAHRPCSTHTHARPSLRLRSPTERNPSSLNSSSAAGNSKSYKPFIKLTKQSRNL